jgi:putative hemolysin
VLEKFDGLPKPGDEVVVDGYTFHVQSMRGRRVAMLRVTAPEPQEATEEEPAQEEG